MNSILDKKRFGKRLLSVVFGGLFITALICACQKPVYVTDTASELANFNTILVLPFQDMTMIPGPAKHARCLVCGRVFLTGEVADNAANFLTQQTLTQLKRHTQYRLVIEQPTRNLSTQLYSAEPTSTGTLRALAEKGRKNNTDVVLLGLVYRFKERVGTGYSAESPASVAFGMHLIRATDGRTIWSAHYDETQKSLGTNLFELGTFLSRGGRWVTAEELSASGLEDIFKKFPSKNRLGSE